MMKQFLRGRVFGHPVHPMLVHFPTALFIASFVFDALGLWLDETQFAFASFYCITMGLSGGLMAAFFGIMDYVKLTKESETVFFKASWHGGIQFCVLSGFGIFFGIRMQAYPELFFPTVIEMAASGFMVLLMLIGNYLGGDLVFQHGVGVGVDED